jgi:hypothetical protein
MRFSVLLLLTCLAVPGVCEAQAPSPSVEKLGNGLLRVQNVRVDTTKREVSVAGKVNNEMTEGTILEFIANGSGGGKTYETALGLDTDAVALNTALLLIGLDPKNARVPTMHFDPIPPAGDPVEIWVEWTVGGNTRRVRVEELLYDKRTRRTMPPGPWVYTGSTFFEGRFLATLEGVLIGFVHSPSPLIENPSAGAVGAFGSVVFNTRLGLTGGSPITLIVRAIGARK